MLKSFTQTVGRPEVTRACVTSAPASSTSTTFEAGRIDLARGANRRHAAASASSASVARHRIRGEVCLLAELRGVHESDATTARSRHGRLEERTVAVVQRAHGRHETDLSSSRARTSRWSDDLHVASASVPPARVS